MAGFYSELQKYEVVGTGNVWSVVAIDQDDQQHLICEFEDAAEAERRAERLNRKLEAQKDPLHRMRHS
jgi:hypothetical protein